MRVTYAVEKLKPLQQRAQREQERAASRWRKRQVPTPPKRRHPEAAPPTDPGPGPNQS